MAKIILIGLCLTLFSCEEEDAIPKPVINNGVSNYSIFIDETVEIKPEVTTEGDTYYQWLENDKELSNKAYIVYKSTIVGKHQILFSITNDGGSSESKYDVEIKAIPKPINKFAVNKDAINIKNGEEIEFTPEVTSIRECTYIWEENKKNLSTTKGFKYSSTDTGLHKLIFKSTNIGGVTIDTLKINVSSIPKPTINISIPEGGFSVRVNEIITISPEISSKKDVTYSWLEGDKELSKEKVFSYYFLKRGKHTITLKATNEGGTSSKDFDIKVNGTYAYGTYVVVEGNMSDQNGRLCFIDNDGNYESDSYYKANGTYIGNVFQDMYIYNDDMYLLTQNGDKLQGDGRLVIADAHTLKKKRVIKTAEMLNPSFWPQHIVVINDSKAYIRYSTSDMEQNSGIKVLDIPSGNLSTENIEGTYGKFTVKGSTKVRMVYSNGIVYAPCGHDLCVIDANTDKIIKRIEFGRQIKGIVKGHDGNIWMTIAGTYKGNQNWKPNYTGQSSIVGISSSTYEIIKDYTLDKGFNFPVATWTPGIGMCASFTEDALFFWNGPFKSTQVYRFDYNTGQLKELLNIKDYNDLGNTVYGYVGVDKQDNLYVGTTSYMTTKVAVFDAKTGNRKDITDKNMDGDEDGKIDNYYFNSGGSPSGIDFSYRFNY